MNCQFGLACQCGIGNGNSHARASPSQERHPSKPRTSAQPPTLSPQTAISNEYSQIRIDPGHMRVLDRLGQGLKPALGLPFERVLAPHGLVPVARGDVREDDGALRDGDLAHHRTVDTAERL